MDAENLLNALGVALGLPQLRFDESGCARIEVNGAPALNFECDEAGGIQLYSVLAPLPTHEREALFLRLLEGNLFGAATAGASLAVDSEFGQIALCRTIRCGSTSAHAFVADVEAFVLAAEDWQSRIEEGAAPAQPAGDTFSARSPHGHLLRA